MMSFWKSNEASLLGQLLTCCLYTPNALFCVQLCDAVTGTLHTPFLFCQLALSYVLPTVEMKGERKVGGQREGLLLSKGFLSACASCDVTPPALHPSKAVLPGS